MALTTYSGLQNALADWLNRADLTSRIPDFITLAEGYFATEPRLHVREAEATVTLTPDADGYSVLPADYAAWRRVYTDDYPLEWVSLDMPVPLYILGTENVTSYFTIQGSYLITFGTGLVSLDYYRRPPALSDANPTNWLLTAFPQVYLYGALAQAAAFIPPSDIENDPRVSRWSSALETCLDRIRTSDTPARFHRAVSRIKGPTP